LFVSPLFFFSASSVLPPLLSFPTRRSSDLYAREGFHSGNSRNGFYDRTFKTEYGELQLAIPRDRNGEFQQETLAPYQRSNDTLEQFVIHLYEKGITTDEIADLMERMY